MSLIGGLISVGGSLLGGALGSSSASKATRAQERAAQAEIDFARESRDLVRQDAAPYQSAGYTALNALMGLSGLPTNPLIANAAAGVGGPGNSFAESYNWKQAGKASPYEVVKAFQEFKGRRPTEAELDYYSKRERADQLYNDVVANGLREIQAQRQAEFDAQTATGQPAAQTPAEMVKTDPSYQFRLNEGMEALEKSAGAAGGLLSGGFARKATRYAQDYASTEYGKMWDRLATIAGYGTTGAQLAGNATMGASGQIGNAISNAGVARASGYTAQGNSWANAINQGAQAFGAIDWTRRSNNSAGYGAEANAAVAAGYS